MGFGNKDKLLEGVEADLGINQRWRADLENDNVAMVDVVGYPEALAMTLHDPPDDINNDHCGPSCCSTFSQSTGNSTNNSNTTTQLHTHKENALKNIVPVNKNAALTNDLANSKDRIAAILAQNLLLQQQLAAFGGISARRLRCATGDACHAPTNSNVDNSTHHCGDCCLKIYLSLLCGMPIQDIIFSYLQLLGYELHGGRKIVEAGDNELHAIYFTCIANITTKLSLSEGEEVDDVRGKSTRDMEMDDAGGLLPLCGSGGHCSLESDKEGEPDIIQPVADLTAETTQRVWYGALADSSMEEDEPMKIHGRGNHVSKVNAMDTKIKVGMNGQVQVALSQQPAPSAQAPHALLPVGEVHAPYPSGSLHHAGRRDVSWMDVGGGPDLPGPWVRPDDPKAGALLCLKAMVGDFQNCSGHHPMSGT
jgi:hypothetical protein